MLWDLVRANGRSNLPRRLGIGFFIVLVYFVSSRFGIYFALIGKAVSPLWPPAGVALSALLIGGLGYCPAIWLGAFISMATVGVPWETNALMAIGNTLEGVLGAYALVRLTGKRNPFEKGRDVFLFLLFPGLLAAALSATIGTLVLFARNVAPYSLFSTAWVTWCLGDLAGIILVTPLAFACFYPSRQKWPLPKRVELIALLITLNCLTALVFWDLAPQALDEFPTFLLIVPCLLWISLRFGVIGTSVASLSLAVISSYATMRGFGPFIRPTQNQSLMFLQFLIITISMSGLVIAATITEKRMVLEELKASIARLTRKEEELRTQASLLNAIIEGTTDAVYAKDMDGRYLLINTAGARLVGKEPHDILGKDDFEIFEEQSARSIAQRDRNILITRKFETYEETAVSSAGLRTYLGTKGPFLSSTGEMVGLVGISRDITERKKTETDLRRSNAELEHFAYVASHDLQEPLRMVISHLQLLEKRSSGLLDADSRDFIGFAIDGARRMRDLIHDLLTYSRVARRDIHVQVADCEMLLSRALFNLKESIEETGAAITREPLPTIMGDAGRLTQLFQNLIGNAIKYRKPNVIPHVRIGAEQFDHEWRFWIEDNGIGIETQFHERIFAMFQRLHSRDQYPGTGIGLAICKKVVEQHGGRLWVESEMGVGSTFHFTLTHQEIKSVPQTLSPMGTQPLELITK